jgi:hypothetical protein
MGNGTWSADAKPRAKKAACDPWGGHPADHQEEARRVVGCVPPFTWVTTMCPNRLCVRREHLIVRHPLELGYPSGICIYCGQWASQRDHLIPEPWSGPTVRTNVATVPSCRECNTLIGDYLTFSITKRRAYAHEKLRERYAKWLRCKRFTADELDEMGPNLRSTVEDGLRQRVLLEDRLRWPVDPHYDLRAVLDVGIENPFIIGMLDCPEMAS